MESRNVKLLELIFDGSIKPRDVKLSALESITENFSKERVIGEGGFATVYKVNFNLSQKIWFKQLIYLMCLIKTIIFLFRQ
jgi:hypothetical protein